jgi:hypothetical protein
MNDRHLVETGATLSCSLHVQSGPSGPLLKGVDGPPIPSWGFVSKTVQFQGKLFTAKFLQAVLADPILGIDSLRKFRITVAPETSQVLFASTVTAPAASEPFLPNVTPIVEPVVNISSTTQKIPDSVPDDVKRLLQKFPFILHTGDVMPTPTHGVEHHIHTGSHRSVFAKSSRLDLENLRLQSGIQTFGIHRHCLPFKITMGLPFAHGAQKRWILATLWRLPLSQFGDNPGQVPLAKHARPF